MKKVLSLLICLLFLFGCEKHKLNEIKLVAKYPHGTNDFTEGLFFHNDKLYESTGLYGKSVFQTIDLDGSKEIIYRFDDSCFGEGSTAIGDSFYLLTYKENKAYKITNSEVKEYYYPREGWGLTTDGKKLYASDGSDKIYIMNDEFKDIASISIKYNSTPLNNINELEYIDGKILANVWLTNKIIVVNPDDGNVEHVFDLTNVIKEYIDEDKTDVLNGIAYNKKNNHLYITGKFYPYIFEFEIN